jgi:small subunit ribosomal protein S17
LGQVSLKRGFFREIMMNIPGIVPPEKTCSDSKCPWHGQLSIRGKLKEVEVVSAKMQDTVIVKWEFIEKLGKYERFNRKTSKVSAHVPECMTVHEGDKVLIGECRKLSKTKAWVVIGKKGEK